MIPPSPHCSFEPLQDHDRASFEPATLLGRLAIHRDYQGQKLGRLLLVDALHRSWKNSSQVASVGVVAEAIDEAARRLYLHHEFVALVEHPRKLFIAIATTAKLFS